MLMINDHEGDGNDDVEKEKNSSFLAFFCLVSYTPGLRYLSQSFLTGCRRLQLFYLIVLSSTTYIFKLY